MRLPIHCDAGNVCLGFCYFEAWHPFAAVAWLQHRRSVAQNNHQIGLAKHTVLKPCQILNDVVGAVTVVAFVYHQVVNDKRQRSELLRNGQNQSPLRRRHWNMHVLNTVICVLCCVSVKDSKFKDVNTFGTRLLFKQRKIPHTHAHEHTFNDQIFMGTTDWC